MVKYFLLVLVGVLAQLEGWDYKFGRCPHIAKLSQFPIIPNVKYYQILRTAGFPLLIGECTVSESILKPDGTLDTKIQQVFRGMQLSLSATIAYDQRPGHYGSFLFTSSFGAIEGNYVDTDYQTYFITYICQSDKNSRRDLLEVYSSDVNFDYNFLLPKIYALNYQESDIEITDHSPEACHVGPV